MVVNISKEGINEVLEDLREKAFHLGRGERYGLLDSMDRSADLIIKLSEAYDQIRAIRDGIQDELAATRKVKNCLKEDLEIARERCERLQKERDQLQIELDIAKAARPAQSKPQGRL